MKKVWLTVLTSLQLLGCHANDDSIQHFIERAHNEALAQVDPLEEQYEFVADKFVMTTPRVPFIRPRPELAEDGSGTDKACWQPDIHRVRGPLETYPLARLKMKGVIGDGHLLWAIIASPEGKLVKIRDGHYLGLNHGKVRKVSSKTVEIEEILPDGTGCWLKRPITLALITAGSAV